MTNPLKELIRLKVEFFERLFDELGKRTETREEPANAVARDIQQAVTITPPPHQNKGHTP